MEISVTKEGRVFIGEQEISPEHTPNGLIVNEMYVHRLVAERFLDGYKPFHTIRHLDGDKTNNHIDNLELHLPSEVAGYSGDGSRAITFEHKPTGKRYTFKSLKEGSVALGFKPTYLEKRFYDTGTELLPYEYPYKIVHIDPKDSRVIQRKGRRVTLEHKTTGEQYEFESLGKASLFLNKDRKYLEKRLKIYGELPDSSAYKVVKERV